MKAIRHEEFGGVDKLKLEKGVPVPKPGKNEVLIKVNHAGVNPVDTYIREGVFPVLPTLPAIPGSDSSGVVEEVGEGVTKFKKGDRVFTAITVSGSYAEYTVANVHHVGRLASNLSFAQGAGLGIPYYTAYKSIHMRARAKPGENILIHGASGAVGLASVQLAKAFGLQVIGTAGTKEGLELVKKHGADQVFDHNDRAYLQEIMEVTNGNKLDIILEMLADVNLQNDLGLLAFHGRIVVVGCRGFVQIDPTLMIGTESQISAVAVLASSDAEWAEMHAAIEAGQRFGWVQPVVAREYKLAEAGQAQHDIINKSGTLGNLVIDVSE